MTEAVLFSTASLGPGATLDPGVQVGYPTGRAIVARALRIGRDTVLRTGTVIYEGSLIGDRFQTGHNVIVREENEIGDDVQVWSNSVIDYGCRIGNGVKVHSNCYVAQFTVIEDGCFLAPGVMVANDPHPGCPHAKECMRGPVLERGVQVGAGAVLLPFIRVGAGSVIGAGAVVTSDVPPESVVAGNPARVIRRRDELVCATGITDAPYRRE